MDEVLIDDHSAQFPELACFPRQRILVELQQDAGIELPISGPADCNSALKKLYGHARHELDSLLRRRNASGWVLEAYRQLAIWTQGTHHPDQIPGFELIAPWAPVGRYGWRYLIEMCVADWRDEPVYLGRPNAEEVTAAFTFLWVLAASSESADWLHYFPGWFQSVEIGDLIRSLNFLEMSEEDEHLFRQRRAHLLRQAWKEVELPVPEDPNIDSAEIRAVLDPALLNSFGWDLATLDHFFDTIAPYYSSRVVLVQPYRMLVGDLSDRSGLAIAQVEALLEFMLAGPTSHSRLRDYLDRNSSQRLSNFAGVLLPGVTHPDTIYGEEALDRLRIRASDEHVIMSLDMISEWSQMFDHRVLNAERGDLRTDDEVGAALDRCQNIFRRAFETQVESLLSHHGFRTIPRLKHVTIDGVKTPLPCGEIDVVAVHATKDILVVECKAATGGLRAKTFFGDVDDHFASVDRKIQAKIDWVRDNIEQVDALLAVEVSDVRGLLVTKYPSPVKFEPTKYDVMTIEELHYELQGLTR